jgi:hypothetical protein
MTDWVTLPRDFTKSCFKKVFQQRYRDIVGHVSQHAISTREKLEKKTNLV